MNNNSQELQRVFQVAPVINRFQANGITRGMFFLLQKGKSTIYMLLMVSNTQMPGLHIIYTISYIIAYELRQSIWMVNCLGFCHFTELMSSSEWLHRFQEPTSYPLLER